MADTEIEMKYDAKAGGPGHSGQDNSIDLDDEDEVVFGGQVPRVERQVTGITNLEKAKTLMTLSTAGVRTSVVSNDLNPNIGKSDYVPNPDLFAFSNPSRPSDDLDVARNQQVYNGQPVHFPPRQPTQPTFTAPTAARQPGTIQSRYTRTMTWKGDGDELLFGKFTRKSSCWLLVFSMLLAILFGVVCIAFYPSFGSAAHCSSTCTYAEVPEGAIHGVVNDAVTVIRGCERHWIMFSVVDDSNINMSNASITFDDLSKLDSDHIESMYLGATDWSTQTAYDCWNDIDWNQNDMAGFIEFTTEDTDFYWEWSSSGWFMMVSLMMSMVFIFNEWLFYSYNEIMIPGKDHRAFIWWYLMRIAWISYMFTVLIAQSILVHDSDVAFLIGQFAYQWLEADGMIASAFVGLCILVCLCCCCFNESDGWNGGNPCTQSGEYGCERYFLLQSRMDLMVINEFEQTLGTAMCVSVVFVVGWILCGFIPFTEFLIAGLTSSMQFPYIVAIFVLFLIGITIQMCWFVRAKWCGDDEDDQKVQKHEREVQVRRAQSAPNIRRIPSGPGNIR